MKYWSYLQIYIHTNLSTGRDLGFSFSVRSNIVTNKQILDFISTKINIKKSEEYRDGTGFFCHVPRDEKLNLLETYIFEYLGSLGWEAYALNYDREVYNFKRPVED
jgi:hypothetical protein